MSADEPDGPLSFEPDEDRLAHRRDPDLDALEPRGEPSTGAPGVPRPRGNYGWLFGLVVLVLLVYIGLNTLRNAGSVERGVSPGHRLPPFAVPLALGRLNGDANLATARGQGQRGARPACDVRGPQVLTVCPGTQPDPLVLAFVATREGRCARELDTLERMRVRFRGLRVAAVAARTNRGSLRRLIREHGWQFEVGFDRDGAVFARYGIVDCPTLTFSYPGGIAMRTTVKPLNDEQFAAQVRQLVDGSRRRGWKPPAPA